MNIKEWEGNSLHRPQAQVQDVAFGWGDCILVSLPQWC